jgi:hypothetical protein
MKESRRQPEQHHKESELEQALSKLGEFRAGAITNWDDRQGPNKFRLESEN